MRVVWLLYWCKYLFGLHFFFLVHYATREKKNDEQIPIHAFKVLTFVLYLNKLLAFYLLYTLRAFKNTFADAQNTRYTQTSDSFVSVSERVRDNFIIIVYRVILNMVDTKYTYV